MSVDAMHIMQTTNYINSLWSSPIQFGVALFFLYNTLGISTLAGLGVMLLIVPLNWLIVDRIVALQVIFLYFHYDDGSKSRAIRQTRSILYQTRERVFHQDIQTLRSGLKKRGAADFFKTDFEVFGYLMKHSFEFLI